MKHFWPQRSNLTSEVNGHKIKCMYGRTDGKKNRVIEELDREEETYRGRLEKRESEQGEEKRDKERNISKRKAIKRGTNGRDK